MVRYPSSLIGESLVTGALPVVDAERTFLGCSREDVGSLLAEKLRPNVEDNLARDIVYSAELWAEEREPIQDHGQEGPEVRFLGVGLFLDCFEGGFLQVHARSPQVEV
ncbi:MAG: hypothetical protein GTO63_28035 [Anaerolineae bacterium]|nr:hypothetical protein [Anaerolineae bacterium]NIN98594.1 hypothetical protein [Anaerolineae bacterium]NIQ81478.1 hypothetical protein [Anaerolineae bacterium]